MAGKEYLGKGQTDQAHFLALQPGHPISLLYVPSSPDIAEVEGAGNESVGLFVNGFIGIPIGLFILGINVRRPKAPPKDEDDFIGNDTEGRSIELPNTVEGIAFTMYPVADMKRARAFYEGDLGLRPAVDLRGEWVEYHVWDNCFALTKMTDSVKPNAQGGGSIAFEVNDVDAFVGRLRKKGVAIKVEPFATRVCRMAVVLDPEGNALTLHQRLKA